MNEKIPEQKKQQFLGTARHEAGHHIVAGELGFKQGDIKIVIKKQHPHTCCAHAGVIVDRQTQDVKSIVKYCKDRVQVCFAGVLAETLKNGEIELNEAFSLFEKSGKSDHEKAKELIKILRNIKYPYTSDLEIIDMQCQKIERMLFCRTYNLIIQKQSQINGLANKLISGLKYFNEPFIYKVL